MRIEVVPDEKLAEVAAERMAAAARRTLEERVAFFLALSGGGTPVPAFHALAVYDLPWERIHVFQVDERIAPDGDPDRNLNALEDAFIRSGRLPHDHLHAMPVTAGDMEDAARHYAREIIDHLGDSPVFDYMQLGIGPDGHTASLFPDDTLLDVRDRLVAISKMHEGRRRMTLTLPAINASREILWLVADPDKAEVVGRWLDGDTRLPAAHVEDQRATALLTAGTAAELDLPGGGP